MPPIRAELDSLLDAGIDEARQTVVALRDAAQTDVPGGFTELLARETNRFEERTGITTRAVRHGRRRTGAAATDGRRAAAHRPGGADEHPSPCRCDGRHRDLRADEGRAELAIRDNGVGSI